MRMSDWSSDVCSSDLGRDPAFHAEPLDLTRPPAPVKTAAAAIAVKPMISVPPGSEAIKAVTAPDSIDEAHRLLDAGRNEECVAMCMRLFEQRGLLMYRHLAERATAARGKFVAENTN